MDRKEKKQRIPRPLNAFMLFANDNRAEYRKSHTGETNSRISVRLGEAWKHLNGKEKTKYYQLSKKAELEHHTKYPDYIYTPAEARSNKKARKLSKSKSSEECAESKQNSNDEQSHRQPVITVSDENCSPPNDISPRAYGYADWKYDPFYQNYAQCVPSGRREMYQNGQGDMSHYPMPYGPPPFMPPFGYPRFPGFDMRPNPYMGTQYGRMPFISPSMMYQYPPPHLAQFVTPTGQPLDGNVPVNYMQHLPGYYAQCQSEPHKSPSENTPSEKQPEKSVETSKQVAHTESRVTEVQSQVSAYQQYHEQCKQAGQVQDGNTVQQPHAHRQNEARECVSGPAATSAQPERNPSTVQNPVAYYYYGTDQHQPYVMDASGSVPQYVRVATETKTFADLSNGQPQIVKVATHPSQ